MKWSHQPDDRDPLERLHEYDGYIVMILGLLIVIALASGMIEVAR